MFEGNSLSLHIDFAYLSIIHVTGKHRFCIQDMVQFSIKSHLRRPDIPCFAIHPSVFLVNQV